jgi:RND family efflux transporter MFP subunit
MAAFLLLAWLLFGDRFVSGREVDLVKVVTVRAQDTAGAATVEAAADVAASELSFDGPTLFQASGWVEPDPLMLRATALYSGVVEAVHVLEGERVRKGQHLATMVDEDAELDLQTAEAQLAEAKATVASRQADLNASRAFLESKRREVAAAEARLNELTDESDRLTKAGKEVFRESQIRQAALRVESQQAVVEATRSTVDEAKAHMQQRQAAVDLAQANLTRAKAEVGRRQLALDRTRIHSPVNGRIQKLYAAPGKKRMLQMDDPESATIATLYQPEQLQARIDVPLEEAAQLVIGQPVRLRSTLLPDRVFEGRVTRIDGEADIQRNTLQAKVEILNPADKLRPEMLCRAEFLAPPKASGDEAASVPESSVRVALYLPETALVGSGREAHAWALDSSGEHVERRELRLGDERRDGHIRVLEGLRPGDFLVDNPPGDLEAGERVKTEKKSNHE